MLKIIGIILVAIGIIALVAQGITYTTKEKVIDLGPIQASAEKQKTIPLSPILGISALVVGAGLLVVGATKKA
ncbi:MAG TPA: DUF3185 domain-containing protein [Chthoniobacterales bacterium]|jgi:hypothetical protein|nr:DUF3185 domain-containing protein [Chthoniobacterales bacterium]